MTSAIERLKAMARTAKAPSSSLESRIMAETALPVVYDPAPEGLQATTERRLSPLAEASDFGGLTKAFDRLFARRTFCSNGYRSYRVAQAMLLASIDKTPEACGVADAERMLAPYRQWWLRDRGNPAAAAVLAHALLGSGFASGDLAMDQTGADIAMARLRTACGEARSVLAHAGPLGRLHWLWRQADFSLTYLAWSCGIEDEALLVPTFAAVQVLDPHEFGIYDDRAMHLSPGQAGDVAAVERFACAAAKRTRAQFGDLLYARIYDTVLEYEDAEQTRVDPDRLMAGFADWYARFPGQALANRYAAHAHASGDYATLRGLFRNEIREIQPAHWFDSDQPLEAWRSVAKRRPRGNKK